MWGCAMELASALTAAVILAESPPHRLRNDKLCQVGNLTTPHHSRPFIREGGGAILSGTVLQTKFGTGVGCHQRSRFHFQISDALLHFETRAPQRWKSRQILHFFTPHNGVRLGVWGGQNIRVDFSCQTQDPTLMYFRPCDKSLHGKKGRG